MTQKLVLSTALAFILVASFAYAASPDELRTEIEARSQELQQINDEIQETQQQLEDNQNQQSSLKRDIRGIDYNISQLNLSLKSSQINIEKTGFELEELQLDIAKLNDSISNKKLALITLMRELYEKEQEGLLVMLLKNKSLTDSVLENQSITNLNNGLAIELENLKLLNEELGGKYNDTTKKKERIVAENRNLKYRKNIVEDQKSERKNLLALTRSQETAYENQLDELAEKQKAISAEIEKVEEELRLTIDPSLLPIPRSGVLEWPAAGPMSQDYGHTAFAKNGYRGQFHNGIDIAGPIGTPIFSAEDGKVVSMGDQDSFKGCYRGAYGKFIVIAHDNNLTTMYAHLSKQVVNEGDIIKRGDLVGYMGRTGYSTGSHLHFTVYAGPTFYMGASRVCGPMPFGGDLDPQDYL